MIRRLNLTNAEDPEVVSDGALRMWIMGALFAAVLAVIGWREHAWDVRQQGLEDRVVRMEQSVPQYRERQAALEATVGGVIKQLDRIETKIDDLLSTDSGFSRGRRFDK